LPAPPINRAPPRGLDNTSSQILLRRTWILQSSIEQLTEEQRQYPLGGPITALILGGGGLFLALVAWGFHSDGCGASDGFGAGGCSDSGSNVLIGGLAVGGAILATFGAISLSKRL